MTIRDMCEIQEMTYCSKQLQIVCYRNLCFCILQKLTMASLKKSGLKSTFIRVISSALVGPKRLKLSVLLLSFVRVWISYPLPIWDTDSLSKTHDYRMKTRGGKD